MRSFLPIKGPGGRALTPREKVALLVLGLTLVLCLLTLLAGDSAYAESAARNPVFAVVAALCRAFGGGLIGFYAVVVLWSGLIYFKGERIADVAPITGRLLAAFGVMVGISGALGIAQVQTAGSLGLLVGGALGSTFGATIGIILLLGLMLLGMNLAGQGAVVALRKPSPRPAATSGGAYGIPGAILDAGSGRMTHEPPMPDDGDPTPDERSRAVTQAMEEIERSHGVTIVDIEPRESESDFESTRPSIGEEVEAAPTPPPETEEAEILRGLREVSDALASEQPAREDTRDVEEPPHPFTPAPAEGFSYAERDSDDETDDADEEEEDEEESRYYEPSYQLIENRAADRGSESETEAGEDEESGFAATASSVVEAETESVEETEREEPEPGDPYARGGLIQRLKAQQEEAAEEDADRPYASFDWRGRPLD